VVVQLEGESATDNAFIVSDPIYFIVTPFILSYFIVSDPIYSPFILPIYSPGGCTWWCSWKANPQLIMLLSCLTPFIAPIKPGEVGEDCLSAQREFRSRPV
jgi:hypothetical protein